MKNRRFFASLLAASLTAASILPVPLFAVDGAVLESYLAAAIDRLELAAATLENEARMPTAAEEEALLAQHSMSQRYFYSFAGKYREELERYLAENPEIQDQIDSLSAQIDAQIAQEENE